VEGPAVPAPPLTQSSSDRRSRLVLTQAELSAYAEAMGRPEEGADQNLEHWERLRRRWAARPRENRPCLAEICRAYVSTQ